MALNPANCRFGPYEVRMRTRELYKQGIKLKLRPQPFQVLKALVERAGDLVTRDELKQLLWAKETFVDFEHGLNTSIRELRAVLNDAANDPRYIETLPKLGYRMIAAVEVEEAARANQDTVPALSAANITGTDVAGVAVIRESTASRRVVLRRWALPVGILLLLAAVLAGGWPGSRFRVRPQAMSGRPMLAVLPFENLTGDTAQEYFSDGLTEEMIGQLGRLDPGHLGVIARTSVMHYKGNREQLDKIGRELGVQYVLEGSVRRDGERVRVSAQLIQMRDQTHVWSRQYDRKLNNLLTLQGEIAQEIADEIQVTLGDAPARKEVQAVASPASYEAYDLYLKGLYFWNKRAPGFPLATQYFEQAIAKDPNYARAYAGLANTFALMGTWYQAPQNEVMPKARTAALKALEIDESLAEAHTSLALIAGSYDYDWQTAEKEYRRAIQLNPDYATAHQWYAEFLAWQGRFDEAFAESERARRLDPMSLIIASDHGAILYYSRQYNRAIAQCQMVLEMDPDFGHARTFIFHSYVQEGKFAEALDEIKRGHNPEDSPWTWALRAFVYGRWGRTAEAAHALSKFEQFAPQLHSDRPLAEALTYVGAGRKDQAIGVLQKAYTEHSDALVSLRVNPVYDALRDDARFQELLRKVRLE